MHRAARNRLIYGVLTALAAPLAGCGDLGQFDRYREDFHFEKSFESHGRIEVENVNGSVDIASWPRNSIEVAGTKSGPSQSQLDQIKINLRVEGGAAFVEVEKPSGSWNGNYSVKLRIRVPKETVISRLSTTNAGISLGDLEGGGVVKSTNGRVQLARVNGNYQIETSNGGIEVDECQGALRLKTSNGPVRGTMRTGSINAETSNGAIDLTLRRTEAGDPLRATTRNGSITLSVGELNGNPISAQTTNGGITLRIPEGTNAQFAADTSTGRVQSDIPVATTELSKHSLTGKMGSGGPSIRLHTSTGSIHIQRY
jgi:Putative adhesin